MAFQLIDRIAVEDEGDGPAVVCVHGLGGSSNSWTPLMPALARHRVVRVDLPGSGRSQRAEGVLSIERYVEALLTLCGRLGVTRAHWLGHSMGTIVVQHIAAAHPKLVASVALFGPLIAPPDAARTAMKARAAKAREGDRSVKGRTPRSDVACPGVDLGVRLGNPVAGVDDIKRASADEDGGRARLRPDRHGSSLDAPAARHSTAVRLGFTRIRAHSWRDLCMNRA